MPIFTEENAKCILCELKKKIQGSMGVKNAIRQGSVGFENWVQIEMSGILKEYINGDRIAIEKAHDICIYDNRNVPKVVIEIKIIKNIANNLCLNLLNSKSIQIPTTNKETTIKAIPTII